MDSWWIDEAPYPGPAQPGSWRAVVTHFNRAFSKAAALAEAELNNLTEAIKRAGVSSSQIEFILWPNELEYFSEGEKRERALYLQQNRNTGPRTSRAFNRNGRKVI